MRIRSVLLATAIVASMDDLSAALEFSAYLTSDHENRFLLTDLDTGAKSSWLEIGESFFGHVLTRFEKDQKTLTVDHDGRSIVLKLKEPRTRDGTGEAPIKTEVRVLVSDQGTYFIDGKEITHLALLDQFEALLQSGMQLSLIIQAPLKSTVKNAEATRKVSNAFRASGAKGSVAIVRPRPTK